MAYYQQSLKTFIDTKLSENTKGVLFDVNLYNDIMGDDFNEEFSVANTYKTEFKRKIPTMITNIQGEYIPIPNLNGTTNSFEIIFDLAVDDVTGMEEESEFEYVDYNNSLLAIDEFKNAILANYFPLGTSSLRMGGIDSTIVSTSATVFTSNFIYLKFTPKGNTIEELLRGVNGTATVVNKTATEIVLDIDGVNSISVPYTVDVVNEITITHSDADLWTISNSFGDDDTLTDVSSNNYQNFTFGYATGFDGILHRLVIDNDTTSTVIDNVENPIVDFSLWDNKDLITNQGTGTNMTNTINNSILWGSDGNAVFTVYPLAVIGEYKAENGYNYHSFSLQVEAFIGDNFLFGNNFEYYIDDTRVYPVDRNHNFALEIQSRQTINENLSTFVGSESSIDWTQTFFYQPTALLTSLVKKITTGTIEQNKVYTLKVQYPFWNKEYNIVIEGGGINTDINSITTFTLQYKLADDILVT